VKFEVRLSFPITSVVCSEGTCCIRHQNISMLVI